MWSVIWDSLLCVAWLAWSSLCSRRWLGTADTLPECWDERCILQCVPRALFMSSNWTTTFWQIHLTIHLTSPRREDSFLLQPWAQLLVLTPVNSQIYLYFRWKSAIILLLRTPEPASSIPDIVSPILATELPSNLDLLTHKCPILKYGKCIQVLLRAESNVSVTVRWTAGVATPTVFFSQWAMNVLTMVLQLPCLSNVSQVATKNDL